MTARGDGIALPLGRRAGQDGRRSSRQDSRTAGQHERESVAPTTPVAGGGGLGCTALEEKKTQGKTEIINLN